MDYQLTTILTGIGIVLFIIGVLYAIQIYLSPSPHGWTWISVGVGCGMVSLGEMFVIYVILDYFNFLAQLWRVMFVPPGVLLLLGVPMATLQVVKKMREDQQNKELEGGQFDK